ncbi:hypothetical protein CAP35_02555 [Chitinophagaceae bacterium IBVUCB1]|nr:hypothetical protein CAP35_02555 [Chitinophagaceae bacterium IBVUCB1]
MHVLVIPSEEFVPEHNHALGIFQFHQAAIWQNAGYKAGALSITQTYSIPMLLKAILLKCLFTKTNNNTDALSMMQVVSLLYNKLFNPTSFVSQDKVEEIDVVRIDGFYYLPPSDYNNAYGWVKAGLTAFDIYIKEHGKPDVIHAHNAMYAGMLACEIKRRHHIPYVITEHSTHFARGIITDNRLLTRMRTAYQKSNGNYAVSKPFCDLLNNKFNDITFSYLPNVIDPYLENDITLRKNASKNRTFSFLNIAELHPKKNQKLLIEAFAILKNDNSFADAKLIIAGTGTEMDNLLAMISDKKLQANVSLVGLLNRQQIANELYKADCVVLSSNVETFGVVLIEAMLYGKPVISTRCGGPESFVTKENGLLVDRENPEALAVAMRDMITNTENYNHVNISAATLEEFGSKKFLERIERIYTKAKNAA